eukprot:SAG11_NODE_30637_length_299_cov_0.725000_1_plen_25_part_10
MLGGTVGDIYKILLVNLVIFNKNLR